MKKTVSLLLTVMMVMSILTVAATSVSAAETAKVNNETCYVGSTVVYKYFLQTPDKAEDFQGHLEYTDGLKLEKVTFADATGEIADGEKGVMINTTISNNVYYSGVNINDGYDYKTKSAFVTAEFTVNKTGDHNVVNKIEILSGFDGKTQYIDNYAAIQSVVVGEETTVKSVDAESIKLDATSKTVYTGSSFTLKATVTPELAALTTDVQWSSSNTKVATVDNGVVRAVKAGSAVITAKAGSVSATCKVTVKQHVTGVKVSPTSKTIYNGKSTTLKATVSPSDASVKTVTWTSSNKKIATVSSKGVVKGIKPGKVTITVKTKDAGKVAKCTITVKAQKATKLTINKKSATLAKKGASVKVKATLSPSNTYNKQIKVTTSNKKVAKISASKINSGKTVKITAVKKGKANVKFVAADGSKKSATCKVTVKK